MEKGYLCEKRCPFFVPGYRYADKGEGGKNHEKTNAGTGTDSSIATDRLWWNRKNDRNYSDGG